MEGGLAEDEKKLSLIEQVEGPVKRICATLLIAAFAMGCASIVSKSIWPVTFDSNPTGANIVITNKSGLRIFEGRTPTTLTLSSSRGFFQGEEYYVEARREGYSDGRTVLTSSINGWYFGNILFGGLIGLLIVDPLTGAMWKLDDRIVVNLSPKTSLKETGAMTLQILAIDQIPDEYRGHLIRVD